MSIRDGGQNVSDRQDVVGGKRRDKDAARAGRQAGRAIEFSRDLQSDNYAPGLAGWRLNRDTGNVEFQDGYFRGDIEATSITAAASITGDQISGGTITGVVFEQAGGSVVIDDAGIQITGTSSPANTLQFAGGNIRSQNTSSIEITAGAGDVYLTGSVEINGYTALHANNHNHDTYTTTTGLDWGASGTNGLTSYTDPFNGTTNVSGDYHRHEVPFHVHQVSL